MASARRRSRDDRGAAAVEFALVLPVLMLIVLGIVDYGLWFSNSIDARAGVESATRQAIVANFSTCTPPTDVAAPGPSPDVGRLMCMAESATGALTSDTYVKVVLPDDPSSGSPAWVVGQPLLVCETVVVKGLIGFVPLPQGGVLRAKTVMQIEQDSGQPEAGGEEQLPAGLDWSWCTR